MTLYHTPDWTYDDAYQPPTTSTALGGRADAGIPRNLNASHSNGLGSANPSNPRKVDAAMPNVAEGRVAELLAQRTPEEWAMRVMRFDVSQWKSLMAEKVPEDKREACRAVLLVEYKRRQRRAHVEEHGKATPAGDAEIAKLKALTGRM